MQSDNIDLTRRLRRNRSGSDREKTVGTRISASEQIELIEAADRAGCSVSEWTREVLLREARSTEADAVFSEVVALRMMLSSLLRPLCCGQVITAEAFAAELQNIRNTKQQVAQDIRQQYAAASGKEQ